MMSQTSTTTTSAKRSHEHNKLSLTEDKQPQWRNAAIIPCIVLVYHTHITSRYITSRYITSRYITHIHTLLKVKTFNEKCTSLGLSVSNN